MRFSLEDVFDVLARATASVAPSNTHSFIATSTYQEMVRTRLFRFLDEPSVEAWDEVYSTPLGNGVAVWRAVADVDPSFTALPPVNGQSWAQIPSAEAVFQALQRIVNMHVDDRVD